MIVAFLLTILAQQPQDSGLDEIATRYRSGEREQAIVAFEEWVQAKPKSPSKWLQAAQFLAEQGDFVHCEFFAERAFKKLPEVAAAHIILGTTYLHTSKTVESEALFRAAVEQFPDLPIMRYNLGLACGFNKKTIEAQEHFEAAIKARPDNMNFLFSAGENCFLLGRFEDAAKFFQQSAEVKPAHAEGYTRLAMTLISLDRLADAEKYFKYALQSPTALGQWNARLEFGKFLLERRRFEEAIVHLDVVVKQRSKERMGWSYHARCLNALGRKEEAKESLSRYRELQKLENDQVNEAIRSGFVESPDKQAETDDGS